MRIVVNTTETDLPGDGLTVRALLDRLGFTFPMIVVKVNGALVKRDRYDAVVVRDGDRVDAVHLVSGG